MMDVAMAAILAGCFAAIKLFTDWCDKQIETKKEQEALK